ncbi:MFS transporter [Segetibacter aerophilus]|uniref:MFS transporter n=1 Tax=Segetibacter aerophilus TaxID=670293 RepID=A0A512B6D2_9BACT|nr:MFS transporter [Segetibacter aerophilus]GEO07509.1 MFS transporter [Segetibacter aerophilus]
MTSITSNRTHRIAVSAFFFLFGFVFASWASRIPAIQFKLGLSETELGLVLFSLPVGLLVSLPISGWLVAKKGSKTVACIAAVIYGLGLVTLGLASTKFQLMAALFAFGLAGNMGNISFNTQAVNVEALYKRTIMASFHGVWSLAGFSGAALGTFMTGLGVVPTYHFLVVNAIAIAIFFAASRFLVTNDLKAKENAPLFVMPNKSFLTLGLIAFCSMLCEGAMFDWSGIYFKKVVMAKPSLVGAGYTAFMCTMAISRFVADYFTSRFGFKRVVQVSGLIIMSGLLIAVIFPTFYPSVAGFLLVGVGVSSIVPLVYSAAGKSKILSPGIALASVSTISFFGFLIGPPLIGVLAGISSLRLSFAVIAFMGLCVSILATMTKENY